MNLRVCWLYCMHLAYTLYFVDSVHFLEPLYFEAFLWHIHWYVFWLVFLDLPGFQINLQMNWLKNCSFWSQSHHCWMVSMVFVEEVPINLYYVFSLILIAFSFFLFLLVSIFNYTHALSFHSCFHKSLRWYRNSRNFSSLTKVFIILKTSSIKTLMVLKVGEN